MLYQLKITLCEVNVFAIVSIMLEFNLVSFSFTQSFLRNFYRLQFENIFSVSITYECTESMYQNLLIIAPEDIQFTIFKVTFYINISSYFFTREAN